MVGKVQMAEFEAFDTNNAEIVLERRKKDRQMSVFRLAKIESGVAEGWGFIKNISNSGVMIEIHPSLALEQTVRVALTDDMGLTASIRWRKGAFVGMQFCRDINATELLANLTIHNKSKPARLPRVQMSCSIIMRIGSNILKAEICDISPGGARINSRYMCEIGNRLTLMVPELGNIAGTVRWQKGHEIGIKFQERVSVPQITDWIANHYTKEKICQ